MKTRKMNYVLTIIVTVTQILKNRNSLLSILFLTTSLSFAQSNIAKNKAASASRSHSTASALSMIDGSLASAWNAGAYAPQWVLIDLQGQHDISKIRLIPTLSPAGNTTQEILVSTDLTTWQSVDVFTIYTVEKTPIERIYSTPLKNVRGVKVLTSKSPSWVAWYEIEIYDVASNTGNYANNGNTQSVGSASQVVNVAKNKVASASKSHSTANTNGLIDGSMATAWNAGAYAPQWVSIDLQGIFDISKIKLIPTLSPSGNTSQQIFVSTDLTTWNSVDVFTVYTVEKTPIERSYSTPLKNIKGVKVLTTNSPSWVAWYEIEVYGVAANSDLFNKNVVQTVTVLNKIDKTEIDLKIPFSKEFLPIQKTDLSKYEVSDIKKQAKKGDVASLIIFGDMYYYGYDKIERNEVDAIEKYKKAADLGNAMAQYKLATIYRQTYVTVSDAAKYYLQSANQGFEPAIYDWAIFLLNGNGAMSKDYAKAKELLEKIPNNKKAKTELAKLYLSSDIVDFKLLADMAKAKSLFEEADQSAIYNEWVSRLNCYGFFRYALSEMPTLVNGINADIDYNNEIQLKTLLGQLKLQESTLSEQLVKTYTNNLLDNLKIIKTVISQDYDDEQLSKAVKSGTTASLTAYMARFPNSPNRKQAVDAITELDNRKFNEAASQNTRIALQSYLSEFPSGFNTDEAKKKISAIDQAERLAEQNRIEQERIVEQNRLAEEARKQAEFYKALADAEFERVSKIKNATEGDRICYIQERRKTYDDRSFFLGWQISGSLEEVSYRMKIICFVEKNLGEKMQVRIGSITSSNKNEYTTPVIDGVEYSKGDIIWIKPLDDKSWFIE